MSQMYSSGIVLTPTHSVWNHRGQLSHPSQRIFFGRRRLRGGGSSEPHASHTSVRMSTRSSDGNSVSTAVAGRSSGSMSCSTSEACVLSTAPHHRRPCPRLLQRRRRASLGASVHLFCRASSACSSVRMSTCSSAGNSVSIAVAGRSSGSMSCSTCVLSTG